jgi:Outer membrane receptor proteins, mostly Fe transport
MFKKNFIFFMMCLLAPATLHAQIKVNGKILDKTTNEALIGAHVFLKQADFQTISDINGYFEFPKVKKGNYTLIVSFIGFKTYKHEIDVDKDSQITIKLNPTAYLQDEIVVLASRVDAKTPLTYTNIDAEDLRKTNKGADLPYLLQNTPSLVVTSDAGTGIGYTSLRIRGSDLTRINVTLNGVPVNGAEDFQVYFVDLPDLASSIDNIQVQRGVGTSSNGSAAFGASLNIKTDESSNIPYASLSSAAGSFNSFKNTIYFSTGRSENGFSLNGRLSKISSDGYVDRAWSNLSSYYLSGSWTNKNTMLKAIVMGGTEKTYQAWNGIPKDSLTTNPTYNPAGEMFNSNGDFLGYYDNETDNYTQNYYQFHAAHKFSNSLTLTATAFLTTGKGYYENFKNDKILSSYGLEPIIIGDTVIKMTNLIQQKWLDNYFYGFNLALNHVAGRFKTTYGGGWNHFNGAHYGLVDWAEIGFPLDFEWYRNYGYKTDYNIFAKTNVYLSSLFELFADMQYRHVDYNIEGIHDDLRDITQKHTFDFLNPKGGLFFTINQYNSLYASVAYSHREPNRDVFSDADASQLEKVKAEKLLDYELGYSYQSSKFDLNANLFYMDYKDQLVLTGEINNVGEAVMTNVDKSYRVGFEGVFNYRIQKRLILGGNISLSRNKIKNLWIILRIGTMEEIMPLNLAPQTLRCRLQS